MSEFQIILSVLAAIATILIGLYWHENRLFRRLAEQQRIDRITSEQFLREMHRESKVWRQRLSLAIARISEVVDTPPEEDRGKDR